MLKYIHKRPSLSDLRLFFYETREEFVVPLDVKVDLDDYTFKLYTYSDFFLCYDDSSLIGMICCYTNNPPDAYISHVCVKNAYQGLGVFKTLFINLKEYCLNNQIRSISLEVDDINFSAKHVYEKIGFVEVSKLASSSILNIELL